MYLFHGHKRTRKSERHNNVEKVIVHRRRQLFVIAHLNLIILAVFAECRLDLVVSLQDVMGHHICMCPVCHHIRMCPLPHAPSFPPPPPPWRIWIILLIVALSHFDRWFPKQEATSFYSRQSNWYHVRKSIPLSPPQQVTPAYTCQWEAGGRAQKREGIAREGSARLARSGARWGQCDVFAEGCTCVCVRTCTAVINNTPWPCTLLLCVYDLTVGVC